MLLLCEMHPRVSVVYPRAVYSRSTVAFIVWKMCPRSLQIESNLWHFRCFCEHAWFDRLDVFVALALQKLHMAHSNLRSVCKPVRRNGWTLVWKLKVERLNQVALARTI